MFWVMFGHTTEVFLDVMSKLAKITYYESKFTLFIDNYLDFKSLLDYPMTQIVENAYFSVDSFFFIGGVLLSFMWFKAFQKDRRTLTSPISWVMFYVHRIIRYARFMNEWLR